MFQRWVALAGLATVAVLSWQLQLLSSAYAAPIGNNWGDIQSVNNASLPDLNLPMPNTPNITPTPSPTSSKPVSPTPTPTPTGSATPTTTPTPTPTKSVSPSPTPSPTVTHTSNPTKSASPGEHTPSPTQSSGAGKGNNPGGKNSGSGARNTAGSNNKIPVSVGAVTGKKFVPQSETRNVYVQRFGGLASPKPGQPVEVVKLNPQRKQSGNINTGGPVFLESQSPTPVAQTNPDILGIPLNLWLGTVAGLLIAAGGAWVWAVYK